MEDDEPGTAKEGFTYAEFIHHSLQRALIKQWAHAWSRAQAMGIKWSTINGLACLNLD